MKLFDNKRCPRCQKKMPKELNMCPTCRLNFDKFNTATNAEAKQALQQGETHKVLMRTGFPADVKKWKLLLLTIFLGFLGVHYYYVGRKKLGLFCTVSFFVGVLNAALQHFTTAKNDLIEIVTFLGLLWGVVLILWVVDIAKVCCNRFKIPVGREE